MATVVPGLTIPTGYECIFAAEISNGENTLSNGVELYNETTSVGSIVLGDLELVPGEFHIARIRSLTGSRVILNSAGTDTFSHEFEDAGGLYLNARFIFVISNIVYSFEINEIPPNDIGSRFCNIRDIPLVNALSALAANDTFILSLVNPVSTVLPDAVAPTVTITAVDSVDENSTTTLETTISGGTYDTLSYAWEVVSGGGTITGTGASVTYNPPNVTTNTVVTVRVTVTAEGTGTNAATGTSDTATDIEEFTVNVVLPDAVAPTVTITAVDSVDENDTQSLAATVTGGTYDTLSYVWTITGNIGSITGTGSTVTYNPPDISTNTNVTVNVTVTAQGTGTNAATGTSDTASDDEQFTINMVLLDAVAPTVSIENIVSVDENTTQELTAIITGGTYDTLSYAWEVITGEGTISGTGATVTYNPPDISQNTFIIVRVTVTASGTGTNAADGTSITSTDTEAFTVRVVLPNAAAPTVTIIEVDSVDEDSTTTLEATVSGGTYDTLSYAWTITGNIGSITGTGSSVTYNPPNISTDTNVTVTIVVTARGTGTNAADNTNATATDTEEFIVNVVLPDAAAPTVAITEVNSVNENTTQDLITTISGGTYDTLSYAWEVVSGGGTITGTGASVTYNPPNVTADTTINVRVTVTAEGTGTNAATGTSDTATDTEEFTVSMVTAAVVFDHDVIIKATATVMGTGVNADTESASVSVTEDFDVEYSRPSLVFPTVTLSDLNELSETETLVITATPEGGNYDTISYSWSISSGNGSISSEENSATFTPPTGLTANATTVIEVEITVTGTDTLAVSGTLSNTYSITVTTTSLPVASNPTITIAEVSQIEETDMQIFTVTLVGGVYDEISYGWTIESGGGTLLNSTSQMTTYTPADITQDTDVNIQVAVSVSGTGVLARNNTSTSEITATEDFMIRYTRPAVVAPTLTITDITSIDSDEMTTLAVTPSGGNYDTIIYTWEIVEGGGTIDGEGDSITYTPPAVSEIL